AFFGPEKAMQGRALFAPEEVIEAIQKNKILMDVIKEKALDKQPPEKALQARMIQAIALDAINKQEAFDKFGKAREKHGNPDDMRVFKIETDQIATGTLQL